MMDRHRIEKELQSLATEFLEVDQVEIDLLKGDGSDRKIYHIKSYNRHLTDIVGVFHLNLPENLDFFTITEKMKQIKLPVPEIYKISESKTSYLLQYLGEDNLAERINHWEQTGQQKRIIPAYQSVIRYLVNIQTELPGYLKTFLKNRVMGETTFNNDLIYFEENFINRFGFNNFFKPEIKHELQTELIEQLVDCRDNYFVYRDFQSRNIMWYQNSPWFIDYQSAFKGPRLYDLASLLYASQSGLNEESREPLLQTYFEISTYPGDFENFLSCFYKFVLVRRLRSLGSYGFLSMEKQKKRFLTSIRPTLIELGSLLSQKQGLNMFPNLAEMIARIIDTWNKVSNEALSLAVLEGI